MPRSKNIQRMIDAKEAPRKRPSAKRWVAARFLDDEVLTWDAPKDDASSVSKYNVWTSLCGRYRVMRRVNEFDIGENGFLVCVSKKCWHGKMWDSAHFGKSGRPALHASLPVAFEVALAYHCETAGVKSNDVTTNAEQRIREAEALSLAKTPRRLQTDDEAPDSTVDAPSSPRRGKAPKTGPQKALVERDRFGSGVDTIAAKINAALGNKPKTQAQLAVESGAKTVAPHLKKLIARGFVVEQTKGKYVVAKEHRAAPSKTK